ncbi:hypothetical protein BFP71_11505 [Roseivirga misakiensis]|uniref:Uncharacterized protein n=1 Tax=Roseivirga misakiensis TaxID=1563681 RepID=A0A1E5SYB4_9BACT|nr:hypothetical protein BFP71_11505 [Roseivirga misakiensis]
MIFGIVSYKANAHDPDQFSYQFSYGKGANEMIIHLTPKSAFDLILSLKPDLSDTAVIRLKDYIVDYANYFNKTVQLDINNNKVDFILYATNLTEHDATLSFQINGYKGAYDDFRLSISSFTEIYHHTENNVRVPTSQGELNFILDKDKQTYMQSDTTIKSSFWSGNVKIYALAVLALLIVLGLSLGVVRKVKPN